MNNSLRAVFVLIIGLALTTTTGYAADTEQAYSGFLDDYPAFEKGKAGVDKVYKKKGVDFSKYNKVMLDRVVFYFKKDAEYKGVHADELKELSDAFHTAMYEAITQDYRMVGEPGPDVMRIRVAITEVTASKPALNAITTIVPIGLAISIIKKGVTGTHTFVGAASIEAEILDSQTNERIAVAIDTKAAEKYKVIKGMSKWGHAKDAFEFWATRLKAWLDEVHGKG